MIDLGLRVERLRDEAATPPPGQSCSTWSWVTGRTPTRRPSLAPAISGARAAAAAGGRDLAVVVSLCGTEGDPQGLERQGVALAAAGATVHRSNAAAARAAVALVKGQR
jgi:FdrA protein